MEILIRKVHKREEERVILECVEMTKDFEDIRQYVQLKGNTLTGYIDSAAFQIKLSSILYFEEVGEQVYAYTAGEVYHIKMRLYELEAQYGEQKFARGSKSILVNLRRVECFRPTIGARIIARMDNGEDVMISRMYAKKMKARMAEASK